MRREQPEQKTNRIQRPPVGWSAGQRTWKGGKVGVAGAPHPTHQGGAGRGMGESASRYLHPSPTRGAHRSPRLPAGKSLNWVHGQAGGKDLVPVGQERACGPPKLG